MKLWWHKLKNWEYWPEYIIYLPTFFYWIFLAIKFRSLSFYKYANPAMKNGGLFGDGKMDFYNLLPKDLFPDTIFIAKSDKFYLSDNIDLNDLQFPLIVKPDKGLRGIGVERVNNKAELIEYANSAKADFLIQELIPLPNEIGLFYYRLPNTIKGKISGITRKSFLTVIGNGQDSIESLLKQTPRYEIQIPKLKKCYSLDKVLAKDENCCLVPFGNHSRGSKFLDGNALITEKLEETFNSIFNNIDGLYYGRLDIRFNTIEELEQGKNFSIIEFNGAKGEPSHIYDPKHSFLDGQIEIFRHQRIFAKIIAISRNQLERKKERKDSIGRSEVKKYTTFSADLVRQTQMNLHTISENAKVIIHKRV